MRLTDQERRLLGLLHDLIPEGGPVCVPLCARHLGITTSLLWKAIRRGETHGFWAATPWLRGVVWLDWTGNPEQELKYAPRATWRRRPRPH
jgi:hypothetical protein